jgi:hypothetical protein
MVRETIRLLARAGLSNERIHFDDALLAGKLRTDALAGAAPVLEQQIEMSCSAGVMGFPGSGLVAASPA